MSERSPMRNEMTLDRELLRRAADHLEDLMDNEWSPRFSMTPVRDLEEKPANRWGQLRRAARLVREIANG